MAVATFVTAYSSREVDRQAVPPVMRITAEYITEDPSIPDAELGDARVTFLLSDTPADQVRKIKLAVYDDIQNHITRPDLLPAVVNGIPTVRVPSIA